MGKLCVDGIFSISNDLLGTLESGLYYFNLTWFCFSLWFRVFEEERETRKKTKASEVKTEENQENDNKYFNIFNLNFDICFFLVDYNLLPMSLIRFESQLRQRNEGKATTFELLFLFLFLYTF